MYNRRIDQNCKFKSRKQKSEFKNFGWAGKLFLGAGGGSPAPENRFVGASDPPPTAPEKAFTGAGRGVTRPYKTIFRGGSRAAPANRHF